LQTPSTKKSTLQLWSKSHYPFWSYCPFFHQNVLNFNTFILGQKTVTRPTLIFASDPMHFYTKKKYMCVYCHMSKKLLSTKPEIVVPCSGIRFRYLIFENSGKMTNYAVFLPSLRLYDLFGLVLVVFVCLFIWSFCSCFGCFCLFVYMIFLFLFWLFLFVLFIWSFWSCFGCLKQEQKDHINKQTKTTKTRPKRSYKQTNKNNQNKYKKECLLAAWKLCGHNGIQLLFIALYNTLKIGQLKINS
jgi:hypothetical protein